MMMAFDSGATRSPIAATTKPASAMTSVLIPFDHHPIVGSLRSPTMSSQRDPRAASPPGQGDDRSSCALLEDDLTATLLFVLLLVCGSSCSGKTTAPTRLRGVDGLVVHDFDEAGVPADADAAWRQRTLDSWVRHAGELETEGMDVLLTGQSPLGEVLAVPLAGDIGGIAVCG